MKGLEEQIKNATVVEDFLAAKPGSFTDVVIVNDMNVPAYVLPSLAMIGDLEKAAMFVVCANAGLLIHVQSDLYAQLKAAYGTASK